MAEQLSIPAWIDRAYAPDDPYRPTVRTVRKWCNEGRIYPTPRKQGRAYFLHPRATYVDPSSPASIKAAKEHVHGRSAA